MDNQKIASIIQNRYNKLYDDHSPIFDEVERYHQMYNSVTSNDDNWEWDYNLTDPVVFYLIRGMMSRLNPESMRVRLEARNEKDLDSREMNQQIINWEIGEMNKFLILFYSIFRGLLAGRAYLKTGWMFNKALEIQTDGNKKKIMRDIVNRAYATNVRFQDLFIPNRNIPIIEEQPYIIERMLIRFGDMLDDNESREKPFWKQQFLEKIAKQGLFETTVDYGKDLLMSDDGKNSLDNKFLRSQFVAVLRMQTLDGEVFYTPQKENKWILNTSTENEYWHGHYPYISWSPFPEDDEFFSMGIVQPIADLQTALTTTLNQYLTNARKAGNPMWIAGQAANQTPDWMFVNRPDGIIRVNGDPNQIAQVKHIDTAETMITMRREMMTSFERTTAMSSFFNAGVAGGNTPQLNKTATGAKIIDSNIETNLQMLITLIGFQEVSKIGEHFLELNAQYITEEQQIKINDRKGIQYVNVNPEQITANFDVIANADTMTKESPVVKQAQLMNLKSTIDAEKEVKFDKKPIWKTILASFPEMDGVDDIIIDPEQQAKDAINNLMSGVEPEITPTMDHKTIIKLVQVFMMSNAEELNEEQIKLFTEYLDDQRKYVEAEKVLFTLEPELSPSNAGQLGAQMGGMPQQGPPQNGAPLPTDEASLMKSLSSQGQTMTNPTNNLQYKLPEATI